MGEWTSINLGGACLKIGSGATPRGGSDVYLADGPYALIRSQNVYNDGFHHDGLAYIGAKHASELANVEVLDGDVLLNITGDSVARACQVDRRVLPARVNQHVAIIRPDPDRLDPRFLRYVLVSPEMQTMMLSWAGSGGTRNALTKAMIESFDVSAPEDVDEQRAIAHILGTLDDKIELNRRMNETLEAMAQALFKSWFVDFDPVRAKAERRDVGLPKRVADLFPDSFEDSALGEIPERWTIALAGELFDVAIGKTPPRKEGHWFSTSPQDIPWMSIRDLGQAGAFISNVNEYLTPDAVERFRVRRIPDGTVVLSFKLTVGRVAITDGEMLSNEAIAHFRPCATTFLSAPYLYCYLRNFDYASLGSTSSIATAVNSDSVRTIPLLVPSDEVHEAFLRTALPLSCNYALFSESQQLLPPYATRYCRDSFVGDAGARDGYSRTSIGRYMTSRWPRGSEWRRWDLHVHTPDSFEHQFESWDDYLAALRGVEGVSVLGVTDYFFIDGYRKIRDLRLGGDLSNFDIILPNIELRLGTFIPKRSDGSQLRRLNVHVIFSNHLDPDIIDQQFVQALQFQVDGYPEDNRGVRNLTRQAVADVGRKVKQNQASFANDSDFVAGCKVITFDLTGVQNLLQRDLFAGKYLVFLAAENWDQISWSGQDYLVRKNLLQSAHGLFCGQRSTIEWCLGRHPEMNEDAFKTEFDVLKPCIHGSDAHAIADLCKPKDDKLCWIKADPTFEGLRQIVYEPADRVYIGPSPPLYHDEARVLTSLALSNTAGWFGDLEIPLNPGLVSIIGQKGAGKSALAEIIAHAANNWNNEEAGSFLRRAGSYLDDALVTLTWADGTTTSVCLGAEQSDERKVRYLSQKFVERLCAEDRLGDELVREIESVIFASTPPTETLNASDFGELRRIRTDGIRAEAQRLQEEIVRLIREESSLRENARKLPEKQARIKSLQQEEAGLVKQIPKPATEEERRLQEKLQQWRNQLTANQQSIATDRTQLQKLMDVRTRISAFESQIAHFVLEIDGLLNEAGIPDADKVAFHPTFTKDRETPLARRKTTVEDEIKKKEGAADQPAEGTVRWLEAQIKKLVERESADKARHERTKTIQTRIAAIAIEVKRIQEEVAQIEGPEKARMETAYNERLDAYAGYFRVLQEEQKTLEELYAPVKARLAVETGSVQDLEFSIRWHADLGAWLERGSVLFDQRRTLPYGTFSDLSKAAQQLLAPAWSSGNPEKIRKAHEQFLEVFKKTELKPKDYLRSDATQQSLVEWLYDVAHITLNYGLKYNGADLEKLSPGTKGIVLLILYLGLDTVDTRPLIVDQPDENLDNESIYKLLTRYFRDAKNRRQIILITHNPNLVVNADSEQIIVASCAWREVGLPYISYVSGSLENTADDGSGIREQTCRILEGGTDAFRRRELRYSLQASIRAEPERPEPRALR